MTAETKNFSEPQLVEDSQKRLQNVAHRTYSSQKQPSLESERIIGFLPMIHKIVRRVVTYIKPPLSYDDLISAGSVGLVKAARDYDPSQQAEFKTYAYIRVKGAILDELREWSFVPPTVDKQIRTTLQASLEITEQTGSAPSDEDLAEKLEITVDKLYQIFKNARAKHFVSIDSSRDELPTLASSLVAANTTTPMQQFEKTELLDKLIQAIRQLNKRERQSLLLY